MARQREQARAAGKFKMAQGLAYSGADTTFHGYDGLSHEGAKVVALYVDGSPVEELRAGDDGVVVLDHTPFYAESGGQVGDTGELRNGDGARPASRTRVKIQAAVFGHEGRVVEGEVRVGDVVDARVDVERRAKTMRNHSVTHLMHKALREVLGEHVQQKGSLVDAGTTRFDFAHNAPMTAEQIRRVEALVNAEILANHATQARVLPMEEAQKLGAMMLFGEKYGDEVRVLDIGSSRELCGGTHVAAHRRHRPVQDRRRERRRRRHPPRRGGHRRQRARLPAVARRHGAAAGRVAAVVARGSAGAPGAGARARARTREGAGDAEGPAGVVAGRRPGAQAVDVKGLKVLAATLDGADAKALRETLDKHQGQAEDGRRRAGGGRGRQGAARRRGDRRQHRRASRPASSSTSSPQQVGGKGGGKADMAMAGGSDPARLDEALASVRGWVEDRA